MNILKTWYEECTIDPLDPDTSSIIKLITPQSNHILNDPHVPNEIKTKSSGVFRFNEDRTAFCSKETILNDKRLNLLTARFNSHLQLKDVKKVPHTSRELPPNSIGPETESIIQDVDWIDPIDVQRHEGKKRLFHIYKEISNNCERLNKHLDSQDLLIGNEVPTLSSFLSTIRQLFISNRPLNPQRCRPIPVSSIRSIAFAGQPKTTFKLIVNVIRAQGVPLRNVEASDGEKQRRLSLGSFGYGKRDANVVVVDGYIIL